MAVDVRLPVLGDFMQEGTLVEWLQPDGARVRKGEPLYRLETDKVALDVEAPADGILRQVATAGAVVPVNGLLGQIAEEAETAPPSNPHAEGAPARAPGETPGAVAGALTPALSQGERGRDALTPTLSQGERGRDAITPALSQGARGPAVLPSPPGRGAGGEGATAADEVRASPAARRLARELGVDLTAVAAANRGARIREEHVQAYAASAAGGAVPAASGSPNGGGAPLGAEGEMLASPAARRLARELGVDIAAVARANPGVRLREQHVQAFAATASPLSLRTGQEPADRPAASPRIGGPGGPSRTPLAGRRRVIAQRMHQSLQQMAQLTVSLQVDVTDCVRLREQLVRLWAADGVRPTYTDFVVRAAALALREHPALNATLEDDALLLHDQIDIGLAVDAPEGLIVPVLRGADGLSLRELARRTAQAAEQARANRLGPDDLHGGTFTVTTLGALGIDFFTPIVNPPQVAIIGIGRVFAQLALVGGQVAERQAMYLNLSFDHRAVDGAPASRFLNRVKELLELPVGLL